MTPLPLLCLSFLLHSLLIFIGAFLDTSSSIHFTDIDYSVFSDAALSIYSGHSPYQRETYRYSPFLFLPICLLIHRALLLLPNHFLSPLYGKFLFSLFDVLCGVLLYSLLLTKQRSLFYTSLWLFNPFVLFISTRGSADALVCFLLFATLLSLSKRKIALAAFFYGLAIHFRLFPVIYALAFFLYCNQNRGSNLFSRDALLFTSFSLLTFFAITLLATLLYGCDVIQHAFLYHLSRVDFKHSYSLFFYPTYLSLQTGSPLHHIALLSQLLLLFLLSIRFYPSPPTALLLLSLLFVTFNRVITAQYTLWWIAPLLLEVPNSSLTLTQWILLLLLLFLTQNVWNLAAYRLEFKGEWMFRSVWIASIFYFIVHCLLLILLIRHHKEDDSIHRKVDSILCWKQRDIDVWIRGYRHDLRILI